MIIATSITEEYLEKSKPFFESANKHFEGEKICFCIGFICQIEGWDVVYVPIEGLKCKWQPKNRKNYYSLQHGEFVEWYNFKDNETILFVDSDMILQRPFDIALDFKETDFYTTDSSFPATLLQDAAINLNVKAPIDFFDKFNITSDSSEEEFCAAWMTASVKNWKKLFKLTKSNYLEFLSYFEHHAAWQLLINYTIINYFRYKKLAPNIQNAIWYSGTSAQIKNDTLFYQDKTVYFNHTKFNGNWKY